MQSSASLLTRAARLPPGRFVLLGGLVYAALRTAAPYAAWKLGVLPGGLLGVAAFGWTLVLLMIAVRRRHRSLWVATAEFEGAIGVGYVLAIALTMPARAAAGFDMPSGSALPLLVGVTVLASLLTWPIVAGLIAVGRRLLGGGAPPHDGRAPSA